MLLPTKPRLRMANNEACCSTALQCGHFILQLNDYKYSCKNSLTNNISLFAQYNHELVLKEV